MSISTFYCNEQILLDNWSFYDESNTLLREVLLKTTLTAEERTQFYFENMRNANNAAYSKKNMLCSLSRRNTTGSLRTITNVVIYQQDIVYVQEAIQHHHLTLHQAVVLFGFIFFTRMFETPMLEMNTRREIRRFTGCFEERVTLKSGLDNTWFTRDSTPPLLAGLVTAGALKDASYPGYRCVITRYEYPCYQIRERRKDESIDPDTIAYQFIVTKENNRLNISKIWDELFGRTMNVCTNCGRVYYTNRPHYSLYCDECRTIIRQQQTAARVNAYRARKAAKQTM